MAVSHSLIFTFSVFRGDATAASFLATPTQIGVPLLSSNFLFLKLVFSIPGIPLLGMLDKWDHDHSKWSCWWHALGLSSPPCPFHPQFGTQTKKPPRIGEKWVFNFSQLYRINGSNRLIIFFMCIAFCNIYRQYAHGLKLWYFIAHLVILKHFKIYQLFKFFTNGIWAIAAALKVSTKTKHEDI